VFSWVAIIVVIVNAGKIGGDPNKIIRGVDMHGRICGVDAGVENATLAAWPYPPSPKVKTCVTSCNYTMAQDSDRMGWRYESKEFLFYCIPLPVPAPTGTIDVEVGSAAAFIVTSFRAFC
jgi:hypothetical protein